MRPDRLVSLLALLLLAPAERAQEPQRPTAPHPQVLGVDVTFLANDGFLLKSGRYSVLIDSFLREPVKNFGALPVEAYRSLVNAEPPYDGLTAVLVSHVHPDHVQFRGLEKYLEKNKQAHLMASRSVARGLREGARDFDSIRSQVTVVPTVRGTPNTIMQEEMSIGFLELAHEGRADAEVLNLGHLIEIGGLRILHVGDAEASLENFEAYRFPEGDIDIAIIPYWFFGTEAGLRVLSREIRPRWVIAAHVPPSEVDRFSELVASHKEVVVFHESLETRHFEPREAPPAGGGSEAGDQAGGEERGEGD